MPDLVRRTAYEDGLQSAVQAVFRRWRNAIAKAGKIVPVVATNKDREAVGTALARPFAAASGQMAKQLSFDVGEDGANRSLVFIAKFTDGLLRELQDNTNAWLAKIAEMVAREDAEESEEAEGQGGDETEAGGKGVDEADLLLKRGKPSFGSRIASKVKSVFSRVLEKADEFVFSAKRATVVAITEVTRMVTAGERMVVSLWNRALGRTAATPAEATPPAQQPPPFVPPQDLMPRWFTNKDERVCPLCNQLHGKLERDWPEDIQGDGPPLHPRCRCTVEWEAVG